MNIGGAFMMFFAWSVISGLCVYCFYRLLREKKVKKFPKRPIIQKRG